MAKKNEQAEQGELRELKTLEDKAEYVLELTGERSNGKKDEAPRTRELKSWRFDFSDPLWEKAKPFREWTRAANRGDMDTLIRMAMTFVTSWPYPGDPAELEAWDELSVATLKQALAEVGDAVGDQFPK